MALTDVGVKMLTTRLPKVISPKQHAIIDYAAVAGGFLALAPILWKRKKRAAIASLACGAMELTTNLLTDYPGGVAKVISFPTHIKIDAGFAGVVASLPSLMGFSDYWAATFFRLQGLSIAAVGGLTQVEEDGQERRRRRRAA